MLQHEYNQEPLLPRPCNAAKYIPINKGMKTTSCTWLASFLLVAALTVNAATTSGPITGSETWSNSVYLTGDVTVTPSGSLTILPGTTIQSAPRSDDQIGGLNTSRIELIVNQGTFTAVGTEALPIVFTAATISPTNPPQPGDWYGIRINSTNAVLCYCTVQFGNEGLRIEGGNIAPQNSLFQSNSANGIVIQVPTLLSNCVMKGNQTGLSVGVNCTATLAGCRVEYNSGNGTGPGSEIGPTVHTVIASDSTFSNNGGEGISAWGGTASLSNSTVANNGGFGIDVGP